MKNSKKIGIYMDHSKAHFIEFDKEAINIKAINSDFTQEDRENSLKKGEKIMHRKEQSKQNEFYHKIREVIENYGKILLFGPGDAKRELFNILTDKPLLSIITVEVAQTDKLTENQQLAYVKQYFKSPQIIK